MGGTVTQIAQEIGPQIYSQCRGNVANGITSGLLLPSVTRCHPPSTLMGNWSQTRKHRLGRRSIKRQWL